MDKRYYLLDLLRGLAALFVVIWHYRHFYYVDGIFPENVYLSEFPLNTLLKIPYEYGGLAVEFFFCLSGFIFFQFYYSKISLGKISFRAFFLRRLLRLYPIFLFSLLLTILLNYYHEIYFGSFFVYEFNDLKHFIYNLLLIHQWGFQEGWSFNGPSWSISVEWLLYLVFFAVCLLRVNIFISSLIMIIAGFILFPFNPNVGRGMILFFFSAFIWLLSNYEGLSNRIKSILVLLYLLMCLFSVTLIPTILLNLYPSLFNFLEDKSLFELFFIIGIVPATVYFASSVVIKNNFFNKFCDLFGQLSYPIYLFHFPVQIFLINFEIINEPNLMSSLFVYLFAVFAISYLFNKYLDIPLRNELTKRFL